MRRSEETVPKAAVVMNGVTYITERARGGCAQGFGIYIKMLLTREVGFIS
jgi:hypothetical protein